MDTTEVRDGLAESPTDDELRSWDWRTELERQERPVTWLARHTQRSASAVHKYDSGDMVPPISWLRQVAVVLNWRP